MKLEFHVHGDELMAPDSMALSGSAGRVLRVGRGDAAYSAYVPHPLPPTIVYERGLVRTLSKADRALGELAGFGRRLPNPYLVIRPFIRREAVLSSRIEGTQATVTDLYAYEAGELQLPGMKPPAAKPDVLEVRSYVEAMEYGLERLATLPVSLRLIRELHAHLMEGVRGEHATPGEFRRSQNWIGRPGCALSEATFVPPPVPEMHEALDAFEKYLHVEDDQPPLVRLALIHYQFEAIHPFLDGNGRIGRLLLTLLLVHWRLLPLPLLYLSAFFDRHREGYYALLRGVSHQGAWRDWLTFFLEGVTEQATDAVERARLLQDLQTQWRRDVQAARRTSSLTLSVVDYLFEQPIVSAAKLQRKFGISAPGALKILRRLAEIGVVREVTGRERGRLYVADAILDTVSQ